jgi:hypothetical protein
MDIQANGVALGVPADFDLHGAFGPGVTPQPSADAPFDGGGFGARPFAQRGVNLAQFGQ